MLAKTGCLSLISVDLPVLLYAKLINSSMDTPLSPSLFEEAGQCGGAAEGAAHRSQPRPQQQPEPQATPLHWITIVSEHREGSSKRAK